MSFLIKQVQTHKTATVGTEQQLVPNAALANPATPAVPAFPKEKAMLLMGNSSLRILRYHHGEVDGNAATYELMLALNIAFDSSSSTIADTIVYSREVKEHVDKIIRCCSNGQCYREPSYIFACGNKADFANEWFNIYAYANTDIAYYVPAGTKLLTMRDYWPGYDSAVIIEKGQKLLYCGYHRIDGKKMPLFLLENGNQNNKNTKEKIDND